MHLNVSHHINELEVSTSPFLQSSSQYDHSNRLILLFILMCTMVFNFAALPEDKGSKLWSKACQENKALSPYRAAKIYECSALSTITRHLRSVTKSGKAVATTQQILAPIEGERQDERLRSPTDGEGLRKKKTRCGRWESPVQSYG
jgi:hypothetical protein